MHNSRRGVFHRSNRASIPTDYMGAELWRQAHRRSIHPRSEYGIGLYIPAVSGRNTEIYSRLKTMSFKGLLGMLSLGRQGPAWNPRATVLTRPRILINPPSTTQPHRLRLHTLDQCLLQGELDWMRTSRARLAFTPPTRPRRVETERSRQKAVE
jgi:hypothetical protein